MRTDVKWGLLFAASLSVSFGLLYYSTQTDRFLEKKRNEYRSRFERLDLNNDGRLTFEEYLPNRLK